MKGSGGHLFRSLLKPPGPEPPEPRFSHSEGSPAALLMLGLAVRFRTTWRPRCLTPRMSHEEERVNHGRFRDESDRALRHWVNPLLGAVMRGSSMNHGSTVTSSAVTSKAGWSCMKTSALTPPLNVLRL